MIVYTSRVRLVDATFGCCTSRNHSTNCRLLCRLNPRFARTTAAGVAQRRIRAV
jgi:hypothetical protein